MVGAGYILKSHALAAGSVPGVSLQAVADSSLQRAQNAARQFGFTQAFGSVEELAQSDCDVVHVLLPPFLHLKAAETLLRAGKSVFLEKPMGLSSEECRRLGALADEKGLRLGVNHNFLFLPGYERLRSSVLEGRLGRIDHVGATWHSELAQLRAGPFDNWMLGAPANLFFELGPHLAALILDLLGGGQIGVASATKPVELPTGSKAYRSWAAQGEHGPASFGISLSAAPGQTDRIVRVRGSGGSAQLDFARDIYWEERAGPANPILDAHSIAKSISRQTGRAASGDRRRRVVSALRKAVDSEPFSESIARSIQRFYASWDGEVDGRHHWAFGADVIRFCEDVCNAAGVGAPSTELAVSKAKPRKPRAKPTILVVGGTGFIGRRLVERLVANGESVRVLTRSKSAAAIAFAGLPLDIHEGFHGNRDVAQAALTGIKAVYHLAKCDGRNWNDYLRGDVEPTRLLAEEAMAARVERFIYTGTIDSYDTASPRARITGNTPLDGAIGRRNLYARSKATCEQLLRDLAENGLPLVILRPAIVIGAGAPAAHIGVANFMSETDVTYWGSGENKLPLVLVDDVADALVAAADAPGIVGKSFLITSTPVLSARDYVSELGKRAGISIRAAAKPAWRYWLADFVKELAKNAIRHPNARWPSLHDWRCRAHRSVYDNSDAVEGLGWHPVTDRTELIERGIYEAVDASIGEAA